MSIDLIDYRNTILFGVSAAAADLVYWIEDHGDIVFGIGVGLVLYGTGSGMRHLFHTQMLKHRWQKWMARREGKRMAKWRKGHLANAFYDTIHREISEGRMSAQQGKQLQMKMAEFFGLDDLKRIKTHPDAIRRRLELNINGYVCGPKNPIPGPKPGENVVPLAEPMDDFITRRKNRRVA